jgi:hypothetical protein
MFVGNENPVQRLGIDARSREALERFLLAKPGVD